METEIAEQHDDKYGFIKRSGMTLRDYFAGQALVGIVSNHIDHETMSEKVANICYRYAEAMLEARK